MVIDEILVILLVNLALQPRFNFVDLYMNSLQLRFALLKRFSFDFMKKSLQVFNATAFQVRNDILQDFELPFYLLRVVIQDFLQFPTYQIKVLHLFKGLF